MSRYIDLKALGRRVQGKRVEMGLSTAELAAMSGISRHTIVHCEGGYNEIGVCRLHALADALGVSLDWLCGRVNAVYPTVQERQEEP